MMFIKTCFTLIDLSTLH